MAVLYWFESIRSPFLNAIMQALTSCGSEIAFMVVAIAVFWCIDKTEGFYLLLTGFFSTIIAQFMKLWFRIPRPWVKDPNFTIVESARAGAFDYSFPSGHSVNAVSTFGGLAVWNKQHWVRIAAIAVAVLIPVSRMYLGVHTPADVVMGAAISVVFLLVFYPLVRWAQKVPVRMYVLIGVMALVAASYLVYVHVYPFPADTDLAILEASRKTGWTIFGALTGFIIGYAIETRFVRFDVHTARLPVQLLKLIPGLGLTFAIKEVLKLLFTLIGFAALWSNAVRYCAMTVFAVAVWPMTFRFFARIGRKDDI